MKVRVKKTGEIIDVELYRKVPEVTTYVQRRKNELDLLYDSDKLEFLDSTFEINFNGIIFAKVKIFNGKPLVTNAMDGWGNKIDIKNISITEKISSK